MLHCCRRMAQSFTRCSVAHTKAKNRVFLLVYTFYSYIDVLDAQTTAHPERVSMLVDAEDGPTDQQTSDTNDSYYESDTMLIFYESHHAIHVNGMQ